MDRDGVELDGVAGRASKPLTRIWTMADAMAENELSVPAESRGGFLERVGHLWVENPLRILTFWWDLVRTSIVAIAAPAEQERTTFIADVARQFGRTLLRTAIPVFAFGAVMGLAIGSIVGGFGEMVRVFIDSLALGIVFKLVLPILGVILLVARVGTAIAGRLTTYPLSHPGEGPGGGMSARRLLAEVIPVIAATILTAGVTYWILALWVMAGYMSDGYAGQLLRFGYSDYIDFIRGKGLMPDLWRGTVWSLMFGALVAHVAAALGTAAAERIDAGAADPGDYYNAVWESGATTLLLCAALIGLLWNVF